MQYEYIEIGDYLVLVHDPEYSEELDAEVLENE